MESLKSLRVDVKALTRLALRHGWFGLFRGVFADYQGDLEQYSKSLPAEADYLALRPHLSGRTLLDVVECLVGVDHRVGGVVLLGMAREMFAPHVPADHPAKQPTEALLTALMAYLLEEAPAEGYIGEAFRYRERFGTTASSAGTDMEFELLFEAMPSGGLCCPVGEGRWHLSMHWNSFGHWLARQCDEWLVLDEISEALDDFALVDGNVVAGLEAADNVRCLILDERRETLVGLELDAYDDALVELIDRVLPAAVAVAQVKA